MGPLGVAPTGEPGRRIVVASVNVTERVRQLVDAAPALSEDRLYRLASLMRR